MQDANAIMLLDECHFKYLVSLKYKKFFLILKLGLDAFSGYKRKYWKIKNRK